MPGCTGLVKVEGEWSINVGLQMNTDENVQTIFNPFVRGVYAESGLFIKLDNYPECSS